MSMVPRADVSPCRYNITSISPPNLEKMVCGIIAGHDGSSPPWVLTPTWSNGVAGGSVWATEFVFCLSEDVVTSGAMFSGTPAGCITESRGIFSGCGSFTSFGCLSSIGPGVLD